ncbi:very short patch repair endonuclease (plasmid) [Delftia tsuruhatensis]
MEFLEFMPIENSIDTIYFRRALKMPGNMDNVDPATRSRMMSRIRSTNTQPELAVRRFLHASGFCFRLHQADLLGRPDSVLPRLHTVIFAHGCFWYRHPSCKKITTPTSNVQRWMCKFSANVSHNAKIYVGLRTQYCDLGMWHRKEG